jgi:iron complex outermembrane receptor protein
LVAGARLDKFSNLKGEFNPRTGIIYQADPWRTLKLMYGSAFRIPNTYERLYQSHGHGAQRLTPEHGKGWELIYLHKFGLGQHLQVSGFDYQLQDIISFGASESHTGNPSFINSGTAKSKGAELWWHNDDGEGIGSYAGASYQRAVNDANQLLASAPRVLLTSGVSIPLPRSNMFLSPEARFISHTKTTADLWIPSTIVTNVTLRYKPSVKGMDASLSVYNLFGSNDPNAVSPAYPVDRMPSEGRTFRLQVGYTF